MNPQVIIQFAFILILSLRTNLVFSADSENNSVHHEGVNQEGTRTSNLDKQSASKDVTWEDSWIRMEFFCKNFSQASLLYLKFVLQL